MISVIRHISGMTPIPVPNTIMRARQRMQRANVHYISDISQLSVGDSCVAVVGREGRREGYDGMWKRGKLSRHTLKFFNTLGISSTKDTSSTSLLVAPQDMSREKRWERMAWPTWMDMPVW